MATPKMLRRKGPSEQQLAAAAKPMTRLEERREELRTRFTEMQWDLGGAAYEMAARDYFRLDVLAGMAARLQIVDAELAEIERMARLERAGAEGSCAGCGSLHARGAVYCWRCGRSLFEAPARPLLTAAPESAPAAPVMPLASPDPVSVPTVAEGPPGVAPPGPAPPSPEVSGVGFSEVAVPEFELPATAPGPESQRPFARPWEGAASAGPVATPGPVTVPSFAGAVEIPTFERPESPSGGSGPASGGS